MKNKVQKMKSGGPNPFIDPTGYQTYVASREDRFSGKNQPRGISKNAKIRRL